MPAYADIFATDLFRGSKNSYGTAMLALALEEFRRRDLKRVFMVCEKENIASVKIIIRNVGIQENVVEDVGCVLQCYWIEL